MHCCNLLSIKWLIGNEAWNISLVCLIQKGNDWYHAGEIRSLVISSQLKKDFDFPFLKDLFDPFYCLPCLPAHSPPWHVMNIYEHKWRIVLFSLFSPPRLAGPAKAFYLNGCDLWWLVMCLRDCVSVGRASWMGAVMSEGMELLGRLVGPVLLLCSCPRSSDSRVVTLVNESR